MKLWTWKDRDSEADVRRSIEVDVQGVTIQVWKPAPFHRELKGLSKTHYITNVVHCPWPWVRF